MIDILSFGHPPAYHTRHHEHGQDYPEHWIRLEYVADDLVSVDQIVNSYEVEPHAEFAPEDDLADSDGYGTAAV